MAAGLKLTQVRAHGDDAFTLGPIDLEVAPGTLTSVVGPAASGKSLLLYALAGLLPVEGTLEMAGVAVTADRVAALRPRIGLSFQRDALALEWTAAENVALAARRSPTGERVSAEETERRTLEALSAVGLEGAGHKMPGELSGGMRRRVGLARALATGAPVLLLDDATAGLDPSTAAEVLERILSVARERPAAVVLVTADVDTALPRSDQVLVLDRGEVAFVGAPSQLDTQGPLAPFAPRAARVLV